MFCRSRLQKLPDKGNRVQLLYDRAVKALDMQNEIENTSNLLASLNLGASDINRLEWKETGARKQKEVLDSDDDEDPIAILASSNRNQKIVKQPKEYGNDKQLITEEDLKEAQEIVKGLLHLDPVLERVVENENMDPSKRFLPHKPKFKSTSSSASSLSEEGNKKIRDNSAATPPYYHSGAKLLSLRESIEVGHAHNLSLKLLQENQAAERLAMRTKLGLEIPTAKSDVDSMSKYRLANSLIDDFDDDEDYVSEDD